MVESKSNHLPISGQLKSQTRDATLLANSHVRVRNEQTGKIFIAELTRPLLEMLGIATGLESTYLTTIDLKADMQHMQFARKVGEMQISEVLISTSK